MYAMKSSMCSCDRKALIEKLYVFLRTHCDRKVAMCSCEHIAIEKLYTKSIESIYGLEKLYVFLRLLKSRILRLPVLFLHRKALCVLATRSRKNEQEIASVP